MKNFLIRDLETLSGIKAHTLRIWEHRYGFIKPERNDVNFRHYSIDQLQTILNAVLLNKNGYKISNLASLGSDELALRASQLSDHVDRKEKALHDLLVAMYKMDIDGFSDILDNCFTNWPQKAVITEIIYPFLRKTGLLFQGNRITEEHFAITAIRQKLFTGIENIKVKDNAAKRVLLFLPEGRHLDLVLLYTNYLLKLQGYSTLYMGADVSENNLNKVLEIKKPRFVFTYLPSRHKIRVQDISQYMDLHIPDATMVIATYLDNTASASLHKNVKQMNFEDALTFFSNSSAVAE